jgi:hypothetical protein
LDYEVGPVAHGVNRLQPHRIRPIDRITPHIAVHIHAARVSDRVGLEEPADAGGVGARLEVDQADLGEAGLASVAEPAGV